jgi:hypothetical protein
VPPIPFVLLRSTLASLWWQCLSPAFLPHLPHCLAFHMVLWLPKLVRWKSDSTERADLIIGVWSLSSQHASSCQCLSVPLFWPWHTTQKIQWIQHPFSLGLIYSLVTIFIDWEVNTKILRPFQFNFISLFSPLSEKKIYRLFLIHFFIFISSGRCII